MKIIAVIPARYAATRFPAKLMQLLGDKTVIRHTYENTVATGLFDDVLVATDHELIFNDLYSHNGKVVMTRSDHESGSDRIAEAVKGLDADVIINVQGDEPFMKRQPLEDLISAFRDPVVRVASLMHTITDESQIDNPNIVKVVTDLSGFALYFSRSRIPFNRSEASGFIYNRHIGVYGYRKSALLEFVEWPLSPLEQMEKLEQLRYLENGVRLKMVTTDFFSIGIDTPEDYLLAKQHLHEGK